MDVVVDGFVRKKSLTKQEFFQLVGLHCLLKPMPPSILNISAAKRDKFQEAVVGKASMSNMAWLGCRCRTIALRKESLCRRHRGLDHSTEWSSQSQQSSLSIGETEVPL